MSLIVHQTGASPVAWPFILWDNLMARPASVLSASGTAAGSSPASVVAENTHQAWVAASVSDYLTCDFGSAQSFDTLCLAGHNFAAGGASLRLAWSATGLAGSWTEALPTVIATDAGALAILLGAPVSARYVKIDPTIAPLPSLPPVIAYASVGLRVELPAWVQPDYVPARDAVAIEGEAFQSRGGQYLGAIERRRGGRLSVKLSPVAGTVGLAGFRAHHDARRPFFFAGSPQHMPDDLVFGWRADGAGELRPALIGGGGHVRFALELDFHAP